MSTDSPQSLLPLMKRALAGEHVEGLTLRLPPTAATTIGFEPVLLEEGRADFRLKVDLERHANPMGTLHGGILCDVADAAMGMACASLLKQGESFTTVELKTNYFRPGFGGALEARARVVNGGKTLVYLEATSSRSPTRSSSRSPSARVSCCAATRPRAAESPKENIMSINNEVVFITGANRGLGLAFAKAALARGARKVYAAAREPSAIGLPGVIAVRLDVTKPETIAEAVKVASDVTVLVNNAGITRHGSTLKSDALARAREEMETNYFGPLSVAHAFAPILKANGGGAILNVLSALSWVTFSTTTTYAASKAATWAIDQRARLEFAEQRTRGRPARWLHGHDTTKRAGAETAPDVVAQAGLDALTEAARCSPTK